ncbi:hypothetical protein M129_3617 [Bacteroides fragilis str. S6R5]|jgi:hypothetical protein|nr:hypothetical protein M129_3617 [Bacteroides fragilis str. S6R5]
MVLLLFFLYACKNHAISLNGYYIIQYIPEHSFAIVRTRTKAVHYRTITSGYPWILNRSFCKKRYIRNLILNIESDKFIGRIQWKNPVDGDVFIPFSIVSLCVVQVKNFFLSGDKKLSPRSKDCDTLVEDFSSFK